MDYTSLTMKQREKVDDKILSIQVVFCCIFMIITIFYDGATNHAPIPTDLSSFFSKVWGSFLRIYPIIVVFAIGTMFVFHLLKSRLRDRIAKKVVYSLQDTWENIREDEAVFWNDVALCKQTFPHLSLSEVRARVEKRNQFLSSSLEVGNGAIICPCCQNELVLENNETLHICACHSVQKIVTEK